MLRNCSRSPDFVVTSLPAKRPILSRPVVAHWYTCDARTGLLNSTLKKAAMSLALRKNSPAVALSWVHICSVRKLRQHGAKYAAPSGKRDRHDLRFGQY